MAKTLITFGDKVTGGVPKAVHEQQLWFDDVNEIKEAVNDNATELYNRTDGNSPHQVISARVDWSNLSSTVQEQDLIWAAVNADLTTIVKHDHDLIFKTVRNVYSQVGSIDTYDVYETFWRLRDKLTVVDGNNVSLGSGNTQLSSANGFMTFSGRRVTKIVNGVAQEGGFTRDFGVTGSTPIEDSVNAGAEAYPGKGIFVFKGNDGTSDYAYIYNGSEEKIGAGTGVTTLATDFSLLTEASSDPAPPYNVDLSSTEISGTVVTFDKFRKHFSSTLTAPFTVDTTGAIEGSVTTAIFNSSTDPDFLNLSSVESFSGSWVADTDLLLELKYFASKVYMVIHTLTTTLKDGQGLLFITSPTPRTEINAGGTYNLSAIGENAASAVWEYLNVAGTWVSIGAATETTEGVWDYTGWTPTVSATAVRIVATYGDATTQSVQNLLYSNSLVDTFTDTNGTLLTAHTPDEVLSAAGWDIESGTWEIQSNALSVASGSTAIHYVTHDAGTPNAIMKFSCVLDASFNTIFVFRYVDDLNNGQILLSSSGTLKVAYKEAGVFTELHEEVGYYSSNTQLELWLTDDSISIVKNSIPLIKVAFDKFPTATKYGIGRGGADYAMAINDFSVIPLSPNPINSAVSLTVTKSDTLVVTKNGWSPNDTNGIAGCDIFSDATNTYLTYAVRDNTGDFLGISYAIKGAGDHDWTRQNDLIVTGGARSIASSSSYWDGTNIHLLTSDRLTGIIYYYKGATITTLVDQGAVIDLTGSGIFSRHPSVNFFNGKFYVYFDTRTDQAAGEFGQIYVCSGATLETLTDFREALSNPGGEFDQCDVGAPNVRYNATSEYYEMLYSGYEGGGSPYVHQTGLAICKYPDGKFERVSIDPVIPNGGSGSIDEAQAGESIWYTGVDAIYYIPHAVGDPYSGVSYVTY